jgi:hypothetical protein
MRGAGSSMLGKDVFEEGAGTGLGVPKRPGPWLRMGTI